jgi:hypothetical protein
MSRLLVDRRELTSLPESGGRTGTGRAGAGAPEARRDEFLDQRLGERQFGVKGSEARTRVTARYFGA